MIKDIRIDEWQIKSSIDDDGHLTLYIEHDSKTKVISMDMDITSSDEKWCERFTCEQIENDYLQSLL